MTVTSINDIHNLSDALDFLDYVNGNSVTLTESELHQVIDKMDATVSGSEVTLLYSGSTLGNGSGRPYWQIAEHIGTQSGGKVATIGQTEKRLAA